jgi:hypothetical protein
MQIVGYQREIVRPCRCGSEEIYGRGSGLDMHPWGGELVSQSRFANVRKSFTQRKTSGSGGSEHAMDDLKCRE